MKIKNIMLVTLMLLAVLTIGAVSATDEITSENVTATDDEDIIAEEDVLTSKYVPDEYFIEVNEDEIDTEWEEDEIASIYLPTDTQGNFQILKGEEKLADLEINNDLYDEDWECIYGTIYMSDFNINNVQDGDEISFKFIELVNGNPIVDDAFTVVYKVSLTDTTMKLTSGGGMTDLDGDIKVNKIDTNKPDENFTYVYVNAKDGSFEIKVDDIDGEEFEIFRENLNTTTRNYTLIDDENGNKWYRFGFSYNDINDFIQSKSEYASLIELLNDDDVIDTEERGMTFYLNEDEDGEDEITSLMMSYDISNGIISFINEDEEPEVDAEYKLDSEIVMKGDWQNQAVIIYTVLKDVTAGRIVIYLNDDATPVFNKTLAELGPDEIDEEAESDDYTITIRNLTITEEGNYIIRDYFYDDTGKILYQYDEDFLETLKLVPSQVIIDGNATFDFTKTTILSNSSDIVLTIGNVTDSGDDVIVIYVDGSETPITIKLSVCGPDDDGNYTVPASKLGNLDAGLHILNVTCNGFNAVGNITLKSNLLIEFPDNYELYTTFDEAFVFFSLDDEEAIIPQEVGGKVNVIIFNDDGSNTTIEKDFGNLISVDDEVVIKYRDLGFELNGKHLVVVRYFGGNEAGVQNKANITFKKFDPKDCEASINESVIDAKGHVITFGYIPPTENIIVEVDGIGTPIKSSDVENKYDYDKGVYYIDNNILKLTDGTHSLRVYIDTDSGEYELASGNVYVDLVENIDPALTVSANNITEGADELIVITTNNTFSGVVTVKIANTTYSVNVTNGAGNLSLSGLAAGTYNVTAVFKGNAFFNESIKNTTFVVNPKVATKITAPALTTTYATSKNIVVTLKDANGNPLVEKMVTITFNGVSKTLETNAKGQVVYAIGSKLVPKTYNAAFNFAEDSAYLASSGTVKVTVKKAKVKMIAKKKTFKAKKKVKKYTITMKTDKGKALKKVKVTIKVKGKKYTAKTNNKGKATFKLKKLTKKGKYKAKITFSGNKYYNKLTKKVTIKVKR